MPKGETSRPTIKSLKRLAEMSGMKETAAELAKMMGASREAGAMTEKEKEKMKRLMEEQRRR